MKKYTFFALFLAVFLLASPLPPVATSANPNTLDKSASTNEQYPDDVGGLFYNAKEDVFYLLVKNPTPARNEELIAQYSAVIVSVYPNAQIEQLIIVKCNYSHNELLQAEYEIREFMSNKNISWQSYIWFDKTMGNHIAVVIEQGDYNYFSTELTKRYGDKVVVYAGASVIMAYSVQQAAINSAPDSMASDKQGYAASSSAMDYIIIYSYPIPQKTGGNLQWIWSAATLTIVGSAMLLLFKKQWASLGFQTVQGHIVTTTQLSAKETIALVKKSSSKPREELFSLINEKIEAMETTKRKQ